MKSLISWSWMTIVAGGALFISSCRENPSTPSSNRSDGKNVLLIVVDTLRADFLSCYGSDRVHSPHIDRLAAEGVLFENAFTHIPITGPSHTAMFTSKFPSDAGVLNNGQILPATEACLAETMVDSGRTTAGFISLGVLEGRFGFNQGFETYRDDLGAVWQANAHQINAKVSDWLEENPAEPFFAFVHYCDPHEPYYSHGSRESIVEVKRGEELVASLDIAKETLLHLELDLPPGNTEIRLGSEREFRLRASILEPTGSGVRSQLAQGWGKDDEGFPRSTDGSLLLRNDSENLQAVSLNLYLSEVLTVEETVASYIAEVEFVDREVGELLNAFREKGLLENTLVVLTSDHGEGLGEHDEIGHITQLYDSMVHVPLILNCSREFSGGVRIEEPISLVDLYPTVLDALDHPHPIEGPGRSLLSLLEGEDDSREKYVYLETYAPEAPHDKFGLRTAKWKYIHTPVTGEEELYHLEEDPKELNNLVGSSTEEVQSFRALLKTLGKGGPGPGSQDRIPATLDEETLQRLKSLGYVH